MNGPGERLIRAACTSETITVYQARSPHIAEAAVAAATFVAPRTGASPSPELTASGRIRDDGARP